MTRDASEKVDQRQTLRGSGRPLQSCRRFGACAHAVVSIL